MSTLTKQNDQAAGSVQGNKVNNDFQVVGTVKDDDFGEVDILYSKESKTLVVKCGMIVNGLENENYVLGFLYYGGFDKCWEVYREKYADYAIIGFDATNAETLERSIESVRNS